MPSIYLSLPECRLQVHPSLCRNPLRWPDLLKVMLLQLGGALRKSKQLISCNFAVYGIWENLAAWKILQFWELLKVTQNREVYTILSSSWISTQTVYTKKSQLVFQDSTLKRPNCCQSTRVGVRMLFDFVLHFRVLS